MILLKNNPRYYDIWRNCLTG